MTKVISKGKLTISIDWEDFGRPSYKGFTNNIAWKSKDIERQTEIILEMLERNNVKATFFVLGALAKERQDLVKKIFNRGHEIGIHGMNHLNLTELNHSQTFNEISESLKIVTDIIGEKIYGFRAPFFSINRTNLYVLEILEDLGFLYDSSVFPMKLPRYGIKNFNTNDAIFLLPNGKEIVELPLTIFQYKNIRLPIAGGGYFRILPKFIIRNAYNNIVKKDLTGMIYMHPYEFDDQKLYVQDERLVNDMFGRLKGFYFNFYWNLFRGSIKYKINDLLENFDFITCREKAENVKLTSELKKLSFLE